MIHWLAIKDLFHFANTSVLPQECNKSFYIRFHHILSFVLDYNQPVQASESLYSNPKVNVCSYRPGTQDMMDSSLYIMYRNESAASAGEPPMPIKYLTAEQVYKI